jgi:hypothetical protein
MINGTIVTTDTGEATGERYGYRDRHYDHDRD